MKKKTLAILLCLAMLFTMLPFAASAETESSVEVTIGGSRERTGDPVFENEPDIEEDTGKKAAGRSTTKGVTGEFSMTQAEAAAAATASYDISPNGDGSVMAYQVPNGDSTYTLALYGNGATKDYTTDAPWYMSTVYTAIYVDDGITYLGSSLFRYLSKVKTVRLPETLTGCGDYVFRSCSSLVELTVPSGITTLPYGMCYWCTSLERVTLPEGITTIPECCFYSATSMKSITLPQSVTKLEKYAFCRSGIESIDLTNVTSVAVRCFASSQLKGVMNVPTTCGLSFDAFSDCPNLEQVNWRGNPLNYNIPGTYVHEDIVQLFQESVEVPGSAGLCAITACGMVYDTLFHEEEDLQYFVNTITQRDSDYGMTTAQATEYFKSVGLHNIQHFTKPQTAINHLAQGDLVLACCIDEAAGHYHAIIIYGITEDGYVYVADPAYDTDAWTKYDISTVFNTSSGRIWAFVAAGYNYDTSMKTDEIKSEKKLPVYPASLTSTAPAGAKTGTENEDGDTLLFKSAQWTNYRLGEAEARLDFSYAPEATDYIYILDYSDSQTKSTINSDYTNISMEKTLAYEAIEDMLAKNPEARAAVVRFNDDESASYTDFTTDATAIYNAISAERCEGFTGYAYGLDQALQLMNSRTGEAANRRTVVVFVTDGDPQRLISQSSSGIYGGDEAAALRNAGAELYGIIFTGESFANAANDLAALTGDASRVFTCTTADAFVEAMNKPVEGSFTLTDTIGEDFLYGGTLSATEGTSAVIDVAQRTITWTLNNIVPNTEYTLTISLKCKRDSSGQYVHGDLPTNNGNAEVTENGEKVNEVETPVLKRSIFLKTIGAQAHMIHRYTDISRSDNPALYTDGIRFGAELDMKELQETLEPGDKAAFAVVMLPLDKLQSGDTTDYLTVNVDDSGKITSNGSYTFVNHTQAIASEKKLSDSTMIEWTQEMEDCKTPEEFAALLTNAGVSIFEVTDKGVRYSVYMMFTNSKNRQAQVDREIAYRGVIVTSIEGNGYAVTYSYQRNNSATRIFNQFNYVNYGVVNVKLASPEDMMHGESEYNPSLAVQSAAIQ